MICTDKSDPNMVVKNKILNVFCVTATRQQHTTEADDDDTLLFLNSAPATVQRESDTPQHFHLQAQDHLIQKRPNACTRNTWTVLPMHSGLVVSCRVVLSCALSCCVVFHFAVLCCVVFRFKFAN